MKLWPISVVFAAKAQAFWGAVRRSKKMRMAEPTRKPALFCGWMLDAGLRYRNLEPVCPLILGFQPSKRRPFPIKTGVIKGFQEQSTSSCEAVFIGYPRDVYGKEIFMPPD